VHDRGLRDGAAGKGLTEDHSGDGMLLGLEDIERAQALIEGRVRVTPMMSSATIGDDLGVRLHFKAELFQKTGSFKPRGVFSKLLSTDPVVRSRGALAFGLTLAQVMMGVANVLLGTPPWLSALHLANAAAILATLVTATFRVAGMPAGAGRVALAASS